MATIEHVHFVPHHVTRDGSDIRYTASERSLINHIPQIFWADNKPWREANLWAVERASAADVSILTVASNMNGLLNYANFLESRDIKWFQFPKRKAERCLVLYRGSLVNLRNMGAISPPTASEYMRNCIMFYRWIKGKRLLGEDVLLWRDRQYFIKYFDSKGFDRTVSGITTDLGIPNRKRPGMTLEDGLLPVSSTDRDAILDFASVNGTRELFLMLAIGFFSGMRLGTICDLKVQSLLQAVPDPSAPGLLKISVGPGAHPPVQTKFDVTGHVWLPAALLDELIDYSCSLQRVARQAKAAKENYDLVFFTRFGNSYGRRGSNQSSAINVEMSALRNKAVQCGFKVLRGFRFHQTRCTFGTELARLALEVTSDAALVVAIVSNALLHAPNSEATTFKYIRFVQALPVRQALADKFMSVFSGIHKKGYS